MYPQLKSDMISWNQRLQADLCAIIDGEGSLEKLYKQLKDIGYGHVIEAQYRIAENAAWVYLQAIKAIANKIESEPIQPEDDDDGVVHTLIDNDGERDWYSEGSKHGKGDPNWGRLSADERN